MAWLHDQCCGIKEHSQSVSQSVKPVRLAASPFRAQALNFILYTRCMLIGCKNLRNHSIVASTLQSPAQCPPSDPIFGSDKATIHLQFAVPTVFWPPNPPWPHRLPM